MGGGGFTMEPGNYLLDHYVLDQCGKDIPHICFLPTASGDSMELIDLFYEFAFSRPMVPSHLELTRQAYPNLRQHLLAQDVIYVGGGHTTFMLNAWYRIGLDALLRQAWEEGVVLAGVSSGSACWFEQGFTDSNPEMLSAERCLGLLEGSHCAHYSNPERRPAFTHAMEHGDVMDGLGIDNFAAVHYMDRTLHRAVSSRQGYSAWQLSLKANGQVIETEIDTHYLG